MMKNFLIAVVMLLVATNLWAAKTKNVSNTRHNLSSTSTGLLWGNNYEASNEDEVCIFCHTPHGGTLQAPLWNRNMPAGNFTHYSSTSLSPTLQGLSTTRPVNNESLVCMSCHDGSVAINSIINNSGGVTPDNNFGLPMQTAWFSIGDVIGATNANLAATRDLTDDHPISFSYFDVWEDPGFSAKFHTVGEAETSGVRFFPLNVAAASDSDTKRVECSSCHDPHVNHETVSGLGGDADYAPFLVMPNTGSALCLACHIK